MNEYFQINPEYGDYFISVSLPLMSLFIFSRCVRKIIIVNNITNITLDLKIIIDNKIQLKQLNKAASDEIFL